MAAITVSYSESVGGYTSFWNYAPDWMTRLNNDFFTINNGQLFLHNDNSNPVKNTFYGVFYPSIVKTVISDLPQDDKVFKTVVLESDEAWTADLRTNYTEGSIEVDEFMQKESRFFGYTRKNEDPTDTSQDYGIGSISSVTGLNIGFTVEVPQSLSVGDSLYQIDGSAQELVGVITNINRDTNVIIVSAIVNTPVVSNFAYGKKDSRVAGSAIRGRELEITLTNNSSAESEMFAVSSEVRKSFL